MRAASVLGVVLAVSGCATGLPLVHSFDSYKDDDDDDAGDERPSKFSRCEIGYWLAGLAIDGIVVGSDLMIGQETDGWDALLITPLAIDALLSTSIAIDCLRED